jgi:hypothetical protein
VIPEDEDRSVVRKEEDAEVAARRIPIRLSGRKGE